MHVTTVTTPSRGLGDDGGVDGIGKTPETIRGERWSQDAVAGQKLARAGRKHFPKSIVGAKFLEQPGRALVVVESHGIVRGIFECAFAVPDEELEFAARHAAA